MYLRYIEDEYGGFSAADGCKQMARDPLFVSLDGLSGWQVYGGTSRQRRESSTKN